VASGVSEQSTKHKQAHGNFDRDFQHVRFDEAVPGKNTMAKLIIKQDLSHKSDTDVKQYSQNYMDKLAQTTVFPTLTAGAVAYKAVHDAFSVALGNSNQANETAKQMTLLKDTSRAALELALTQNGHTVESTPNVTPDMALSVGFEVRGGATPVGKLPQVQNLSLTTGDKPGEVDGHWNAVHGRNTYEHQRCTTDPTVEANWQHVGTSGASKTTFTGQTSGSKVWIRVRANAPKEANNGAWSQPAGITVP
jgi:hypothetical protein